MSDKLQTLRDLGSEHYGGLVFDEYQDTVTYASLCPDVTVLPDACIIIEDWVYIIHFLPYQYRNRLRGVCRAQHSEN